MRQVLFKLTGLVLIVASLLVGWQWMRYQSFTDMPVSVGNEGADFTVESGSSLSQLAAELKRRGILSNPRMFVWMARLKGVANRVKTGEYHIVPGTTPPQLLNQLVEGKVVEYALTLVEGWTFRQMMAAVAADPYLRHTLTGLDDDTIMVRLGYAGEHPEGRFLPETYKFPRGLSDVEFLKRAHRAMAERLGNEWAQRADGLPLKTPYEALILASIIEKETAVPAEREEISGVFVRRLEMGMRLQTDPTVIYGLGTHFDGNLRRADLLASDNPYNTYRHRGLPPTPIAMPGVASLHAALHPDAGKSLYFVARGDGRHVFSATLEEHNRAVIRYQLHGHPKPFSSYSEQP